MELEKINYMVEKVKKLGVTNNVVHVNILIYNEFNHNNTSIIY